MTRTQIEFPDPVTGIQFQLMCFGFFFPCLLCNRYASSNKSPSFCSESSGFNEQLGLLNLCFSVHLQNLI